MTDPILLQSNNFQELFIRHHNFEAELMRLPAPGPEREDFFWFVEDRGPDPVDGVPLVRFRAVQRFNGKNHFLRHQNFRLVLQPNDGSEQFKQDSLFRRFRGLGDDQNGWKSFEASNPNLKGHWIRHHSFHLFVNRRNATDPNFDDDATFRKAGPDQPID